MSLSQSPTIVLLHGAGGNGQSLQELATALRARDLQVLTPALPGRGDAPGPPLTTPEQAGRWLGQELDARPKETYVLAGHSMGGGIAQECAILGTVQGLVGLVLMATGARLRVHPSILQIMEAAAVADRQAPFPPGLFVEATDEQQRELRARDSATPASTTLCDWQLANAFDRLADLGKIQVPTLVISGSRDQLTPTKYAQFMADAIPGGTMYVEEGAGHMLPFERAASVATQITGFVRSL